MDDAPLPVESSTREVTHYVGGNSSNKAAVWTDK